MIRKIRTKQESIKNVPFLIVFCCIWYSSLLGQIKNNPSLTYIGALLIGLLPLISLVNEVKRARYFRRLHQECMKQPPRRGRIVNCTRSSYQERGSRGRTSTHYEYFLTVEVYDSQTGLPTTIQSEAYDWPVYKSLASPDVEVYTDESGWHHVIDGFRYKQSKREPDIFQENAWDYTPEHNTQRMFSIIFIAIIILMLFTQGCSREETIALFNPEMNEDVDNVADTEVVVDNTEEVNNESQTQDEKTGDTSEVAEETAYTGPEVTLVMVGDILFHTPVAESGVQQDGSYNYDAIFANVKDEIEVADLALVNQEVIIGGEELGISGYPSFNAPYELGDALVTSGFDVVLHATNHTLDQGKKGVRNCLTFWKNNYPQVAVLGINESQDAQDNIYVYEQDGIRIAILNYTYGTNGIAIPSDMPYAVNLLDEEKVTADIAKAKEQADFIVVCPHWGTEYQLVPSREQEHWTQIFLENGVDLVIGTHPHVIEPVEWVESEDGEGMLVYYSLGNFVNWTSSSGDGIANRMVGGMAEITIGMDESGDAFILEYGVEPIVCHLTEGTNGVTTYFLSDYTEELATENAIVEQDGAFSKEYCEELCEEVWGSSSVHVVLRD